MASIREHKKTNGASSFYVLWRDPDLGKQTSLSVDTREKAESMRDLLNECSQRLALVEKKLATPTEPDVLTLRGLLEVHLEHLTKPSAGTVSGYRRIFENRLGATYGEMPAGDFDEDVISTWMKEMLSVGATRKTIANTTGLLSAAYKSGMRRGLVKLNPFDFINLPEETRTGRRATFLTKKEYDLVYAAMRPQYQQMVEVDVNTGLRFGEITALSGADLILDAKIPYIVIDKAWKEDKDRHRYIGPPKSEHSVREVSITKDLKRTILPLTSKDGLLFTTVREAPITSKVFHRDGWGPAIIAAQKAGLRKKPRFHDLRHTHASWLLQEGVPIFVVSQRLGHSSVDITTKIYGHITPEGHRRAIRGLERALKR